MRTRQLGNSNHDGRGKMQRPGQVLWVVPTLPQRRFFTYQPRRGALFSPTTSQGSQRLFCVLHVPLLLESLDLRVEGHAMSN